VDVHSDLGPLAGISAAQSQHPNVAWLIMACDLPFISEGTLQFLIAHRDATRIATAFRGTDDGLPEPLCAIWEPASASVVSEWIAKHNKCPRKLLINSSIKLLEQPDARALDNINTPAEHLQALTSLGSKPINLSVQYFALFREQAGKRDEQLNTVASSPALLYAELQQRYGFTLAMNQLKVAVNSEFSDWQTVLNSGDHIAFIPPVAGG
jgi:molybdopterin-guanine dinucleotide biosynthesis protein A